MAGSISNKVNRATKEPKQLRWDTTVSQKSPSETAIFSLNLVQYLSDDASLIELRGKSWQLRLLDKVKVNAQGNFYKWFNLVLPLTLILISGFLFTWRRKRLNEKPNLRTEK